MMTVRLLCLTTCATIALLSACGESSTPAETPATPPADTTTQTPIWPGTYQFGDAEGYTQTLTISPADADSFRLQFTAGEVNGQAACSYAVTAYAVGEELRAPVGPEDGRKEMYLLRKGNVIKVFTHNFEDRFALMYHCGGGASLAGDYEAAELLPPSLTTFLQSQLADGPWRVVPRDKWLAADYLDNLNANLEEPLLYANEVVISGDFDGNGQTDYAAILLNGQDRATIFALHAQGDNWQAYPLSDLGQLGLGDGPRYAGVGIGLQAPGQLSDYETDEVVQLQYPGIIENYYEKAARVYYFAGAAYRSLQVSD